MQTVLVLCAHPDDEVFGVGGTIVNYVKEGIKVVIVNFSSGESSHPWLKSKFTIDMRKEESKRVTHLLGCSEPLNFDLKDGSIAKQIPEKQIKERVIEIIKKYQPNKIFTHAADDPHPDHKAVYKLVTSVVDMIKYDGHVYSFDVWNPFNITKRDVPKMFVDISKTFKIKIKALKAFKSQKLFYYMLLPAVYTRAILSGFSAKCRFAEVFYKIR